MSLIRFANQDDIKSILTVHEHAFPGFFLTILGKSFLSKFYNSFLEHPKGGLLVYVSGQRVEGFAAFTTNPCEFFYDLKRRHGFGLAVRMIPALLIHPVITLQKLIRAIIYRGDSGDAMEGYALLSSIAVIPEANSKGIGSSLLKVMECHLKDYQVKFVYLTTDCKNNDVTLGFYNKNGYVVHSKFKQSGNREMFRLTKSLDGS